MQSARHGPTGVRLTQPEEFELVADAVGLWGDQRQALQLASCEGADLAEIAAALRTDQEGVLELLDVAQAAFREFAFSDWPRLLLDVMKNGRVARDTAPGVLADRYGQLRAAVLRGPLVTPEDVTEAAPAGQERWRSLPADVLGRRDGRDQAGWLDEEAAKEARKRSAS